MVCDVWEAVPAEDSTCHCCLPHIPLPVLHMTTCGEGDYLVFLTFLSHTQNLQSVCMLMAPLTVPVPVYSMPDL